MTEVPFQLLIKRCDPKKQTERLLCTELLRCVPGRRQVYEASWNEKSVIVKVFSDKISAKRHTTREWRGLEELSKRQLTVPQSLFYGQTENGGWSVVSEKIVDSSTALDIYQNLQTSAERLDLLILVGRELAKQHIKGVLQKDLHLGNFLLKNDKVFLLDAGQMCFLDGEIGKKDSLYQLATLAAWLDENEKESINRLCSEYFDVRGWNFEEADKAAVWKYLASGRKKAIKRGLKKFLRTNKRHIKINNEKYTAVFDREFCLGAEPLEFIEKIDALMDDGKILKDGNTCYVSRLTWNGRDVVVKRYNHKGLIHSIRHTIKGSRARRCWICGHRLGMLKLATPKPLVYLEHRKGLLIWKSYILTEYVQGQKLHDFLRDGTLTEQQRLHVTKQVKKLLDEMGKYRITHGDLKHTNILITDNGPVLTDLDSMQFHTNKWTYRLRRAKDIGRFEFKT